MGTVSNKSKYRELCKAERSIPIFSRDWWMDAVCGSDNWDVLLLERGGCIVASLPYYMTEWFGFKYIHQPAFTQKNGIWIRYPENQSYSRRLSYEKDVMNHLISQMEQLNLCSYDQQFDYSVTNWLPFFWKGFKQTTKYTYVIEDLTDLERVFSNFEHSKRQNINRALKLVDIKMDLPAEAFYKNYKMALAKQDKSISYGFDLFSSIYDAVYKNNSGRAIYAEDSKGSIHGAVLVIWDEISAYYLIGGFDPDFRHSGASSLLVWEAIKYVSSKTMKFDFEGSMLESVEESFRRYGAVQKPYFNISREFNKSIRWRLLKKLAWSKNKIVELGRKVRRVR